ncbi:TPA: hypothetical protein NIA45_004673 [Pseudomonas aeruginosa]|nr:hypothetical protein [Pseudomonas aeruginosa]
MSRRSNAAPLSPDSVDLLRAVSFAFREACEAIHQQNRMPPNMRTFPAGCCGNSSEILGDYLISRGLAKAKLVRANRGDESHAWIEVGTLVIDVTGDQFAGRPAVYVDGTDAWFRKWKLDGRRAAVFDYGSRDLMEHRLIEELHQALDERFQLSELA